MKSHDQSQGQGKRKPSQQASQNGHGPHHQRHQNQGRGSFQASQNQHYYGGSGFNKRNSNNIKSQYAGADVLKRNHLPEKYIALGDSDVVKFRDFGHASLDVGNAGRLQKPFVDVKGSAIGSQSQSVDIKSQLISTNATKKPVVKILTKDFSLDDHVRPWCCFGASAWKGRRFAQELSSGFSSQTIASGKDQFADAADFISDWKNVKTLLKSHISNAHFSFVLHRVGNAVSIDQLDLFELACSPKALKIPDELQRFILTVMGENKQKIKGEGRAGKDVLAKEAFHKLLHCSMLDENMEEQVTNQFLHRYMLTTEGFNFMVGCDIPVFSHKDDKSEQTITVRAGDAKSGTVKSADAFDIWLDNKLVCGSKTLITSLDQLKVTKTEWMNTEDLPAKSQFNAKANLQNVGKLLQTLRENVKAGNTYWLYRAPDSHEVVMYNISNICFKSAGASTESESVPLTPVVGNWEILSPFDPYFASASLLKYSEFLSEAIVEKLISETFVDPKTDCLDAGADINPNSNKKSGKKSEPNKHQKLTIKIENQVKVLSKYVKPVEDWAIRDLEHIRSSNFKAALNCIEKIYSSASLSTPNLRNRLSIHAVEKYYPACSKLLRALGTTNDNLKFWDEKEGYKKWFLNYTSGICSILLLLSNWHSGVRTTLMDSNRHAEWMYLGSRVNELYADTLLSIATKLLENGRVVRVDEEFPSSSYHAQVILYYQKAMDLIPKEESFRVKQCFVPPSSDNVIHRKKLVAEIHFKTGVALMERIRHHLSFPPFLREPVVGAREEPSEEKSEADDSESVVAVTLANIRKYYCQAQILLGDCVFHLDKESIEIDKERDTELSKLACLLKGDLIAKHKTVETVEMEVHYQFYFHLKKILDSSILSAIPSNLHRTVNAKESTVSVKVLKDAYQGITKILRTSLANKREHFMNERMKNWIGVYNII